MPDEDSIVVRLQFGIPKSFRISVVEAAAILAAASKISALVHMLLEKGWDVELVFFDGYALVAVPVENSRDGGLVLPLQILVDNGVFDDGVAEDNEEVGQKDGESADEEQHILRDNGVGEHVDGDVADVGWDADGQEHSFEAGQALLEVGELLQKLPPLPQYDPEVRQQVDREGTRVHRVREHGEQNYHGRAHQLRRHGPWNPHQHVRHFFLEGTLELHGLVDRDVRST